MPDKLDNRLYFFRAHFNNKKLNIWPAVKKEGPMIRSALSKEEHAITLNQRRLVFNSTNMLSPKLTKPLNDYNVIIFGD
jgi:hypothetical protein